MTWSERRFEANGLPQRVLCWSGPSPSAEHTPPRTVVLVHGFMDAAGTWDLVAPVLAAGGYRVVAPDMRGFGEAGRAPKGSYYHFADYVADLEGVVSHFVGKEPVALVGHSMGGTITTLFAGAFPERVAHLATIEGIGPPDNPWDAAPIRMRGWIEAVHRSRRRSEAVLDRDEAFERLADAHHRVPRDLLETRFVHLVRDVTDESGRTGVAWRFDPLHRTTSPTPFQAKSFVEFAKRVTCPVLYVSGGEHGFHVSDEEERLHAFPRVRRALLEDAGHMVHWTKPIELASLLLDFLAAVP